MKRHQARRAGRFTRNTPENTLGLHCAIHGRKVNGDWCGAITSSPVGEPRPTDCQRCGEPLSDEPLHDDPLTRWTQ